ncbi:MAG: FecR family protein [Reichenbachiella sp.]
MENVEEILIAYFNDDIDSSQKERVDLWVGESDDNNRVFLEAKKIYELTVIDAAGFTPDVDVAWDSVNKKINQSKSKSNHIVMWYKVAAVLLMGIGIGLVSYYELTKEVLISINTGENEKTHVELADGTRIVVNENTIFKYPKEFGEDRRRVFLNGQAYFDVERDESRPFKIVGRGSVVTVLGTSFDLNTTKEYTDLNVVSGKVEIKDKATQKKEVLVKNQRAIVENNDIKLYEELNENKMAWRKADLNFKSTPISEVAMVLENHFDVKILVADQIKSCLITSQMAQMDLDEILEVLGLIANIKSTSNAEVIELTGPSC